MPDKAPETPASPRKYEPSLGLETGKTNTDIETKPLSSQWDLAWHTDFMSVFAVPTNFN